MISFICGTITELDESKLVLECGGLGYEIFAATSVLSEKRVGEKVTIFTYLCVREDALTLFGFSSAREKQLFLKLILVSGVGPKLALSVLSGIGFDELCSSIAAGDSARLTQIKGIGKKNAERIVLELKDKLGIDFELSSGNSTNFDNDALLALISMGYSKPEALAMVSRVFKEGMTSEEVIIAALKR